MPVWNSCVKPAYQRIPLISHLSAIIVCAGTGIIDSRGRIVTIRDIEQYYPGMGYCNVSRRVILVHCGVPLSAEMSSG
jgi:hypothetical protein